MATNGGVARAKKDGVEGYGVRDSFSSTPDCIAPSQTLMHIVSSQEMAFATLL